MNIRQGLTITILGVGSLVCPSTWAADFTWTFNNNTGAGAVGNAVPFASSPGGGPTVTATAWYVNGGNLLQKAAVGQWGSAGLGICNAGESCSSPYHQVDNSGQLEFMLFQFSQPLTNISFTINPSPDSDSAYNGNTDGSGDDNVPDRDVSYYAGSPSLPVSLLTGTNFGTIGSLFTVANADILNASGGGGITVNLVTGSPVNAVLFGALDTLNSNPLDFFKIQSMGGRTTPPSSVPEPTSVLLLGTVAAGFAYMMRKKRATA